MTFSIVARDPSTGAFGVATATAGPMVGALVPHTRAGCGAVATQAMTNPYLAFDALGHLEHLTAEAALDRALAADPAAASRQFIVVDRHGHTAGWTGADCIAHAAHHLGAGVAVAGNMLAGPGVLPDMLAAYAAHLPQAGLAPALLAALLAGAAAGGDSRGIGSAALRVQGREAFCDIDLRADWSEQPLDALSDLLDRATIGPYAAFFAQIHRRAAD